MLAPLLLPFPGRVRSRARVQVLPIPDEEVVQRIHQNFRVTFLKDALLRPMMDDAVVSTLNSLTFFNNTEILQRQELDIMPNGFRRT